MNFFPKIESPCPFRLSSLPQPGMDFCGHCERRVHNLDLMSQAQRESFLSACEGKVCVSYTVRRSIPKTMAKIVVGLGLASSGLALAQEENLILQDPQSVSQGPKCDDQNAAKAELDIASSEDEVEPMWETIVVGGTNANGKSIRWIDEAELANSQDDTNEMPKIGELDWLPTPVESTQP